MLSEANAAGPVPFSSVQNHYSLLFREPEQGLIELLEHDGISLLPYYPLANGLLTGKYAKGQDLPEGARLAIMPAERTELWLTDDLLDAVERIRSVSQACGIDMVTLAFSWLAAKGCVSSVIAGASTPAQVQANAQAIIVLSDDVTAALDEAGASLLS
jgi:aryl-alcohol dehydrogenase-like predicted oxidoreductase